MVSDIESLRALREQGLRQTLHYGEIPHLRMTNESYFWYGRWVLFASFLLIFFGYIVFASILGHRDFFAVLDQAFSRALTFSILITVSYYLWPILSVLALTLLHKQLPTRALLDQFTSGQKRACVGLMTFAIVYSINAVYPSLAYLAHYYRWPPLELNHNPYLIPNDYLVAIGFGVFLLLTFLVPLLLPASSKPLKKRTKASVSDDHTQGNTIPFGLWVGRSTGHLASLYHRTGMAACFEVTLSSEDAAQNVLVLGGIGSGKTTRLMQPLLVQLLDQQCGGLLFDVKGDVKHAALLVGEKIGRPVALVGPGHTPVNLLAGLTPEVAASFLKSALLLNGGVRLDGFWIDTATELCRNTLGLLSFLPDRYTLQGLYSYLFDDEARDAMQDALNPLLGTLEAEKQRLLKAYLRYHDAIFAAFDEKVKSGVNATVAQALSPFNHPELVDAFCQPSSDSGSLEDVVTGQVYLVDMPLARWGLGGKVAYTFIKLRFFNVMQSRIHHPDWNQTCPVFFMCDEYQELISASKDGLSDLNFWDKSRSSKTIGIVSAQSISSFYAALGHRDLAHAILQNFRQKICFRTEDQVTLDVMSRLAGYAKVQRKTTSQTTGDSSTSAKSASWHHSDTESISEAREAVLDATVFRRLSQNQAIALLSLQGQSMDDVLELMPVFV